MSTLVAPHVSASNARRMATAGAVGSVIEWYDYALYGAASAIVFSKLFFPTLDPVAGQLASLASFAVGFAVRPIGGIIFGNLGDRVGRKATLLITVVIMGVATTLIGFLPTFDQVGILAPILLLVLRLIQGLGAGAEFAGSITYVAEGAEPGRRSFRTAFTGSASIAGTFTSTGVFAILSATLSPEAFLGWGWRLAFIISIALTIPAILIRSRINETEMFTKLKEQQAAGQIRRPRIPLVDMLRNDTRSFFSAFLTPTSLVVIGYMITIFGVSYMVNTLGLSSTASLVMVLLTTFIGMSVTPLFGLLADRVGSRRVMLGGAIFALVFAIPYFQILGSKNFALTTIASIVMYSVIWGAGAGGQGDYLPKLFKTRYRFTGVATARELNTAIFSGPAPLIAAALTGAVHGAIWPVGIFMACLAAISIIGLSIGKPVELRAQDENGGES